MNAPFSLRHPCPLRCLLYLIAFMVAGVSWMKGAPGIESPELRDLFKQPSSPIFRVGFARMVKDMPLAELVAFRQALSEAHQNKELAEHHHYDAMALIRSRWLDLDAAGYVKAALGGLPQCDTSNEWEAAARLLDQDVEAGIRAARELQLNWAGAISYFLGRLAAKDPQRAVAMYWEEYDQRKRKYEAGDKESHYNMSFSDIFDAWSVKDPTAAFSGLQDFMDAGDLRRHGLHGVEHVLATLCMWVALEDVDRAQELIGTFRGASEQRALPSLVVGKTTGLDFEAGLALAKKYDSPDCWKSFAASIGEVRSFYGSPTRSYHSLESGVRIFGSDEEKLKALMESMPAEYRTLGLISFFSNNEELDDTALARSRIFPLVKDPEHRLAVISAVCEIQRNKSQSHIPGPMLEVAFGIRDQLLSEDRAPIVIGVILAHMFELDPMSVWPYINRYPENLWIRVRDSIRLGNWPIERLTSDVKILLDSANPRERKAGEDLVDMWFRNDPKEAYEVVLKNGPPSRLGHYFSPLKVLLDASGQDVEKARQMIDEISHPETRHLVSVEFEKQLIPTKNPQEAFSGFLEFKKSAGEEERNHIIAIAGTLAERVEPEFDRLILDADDKKEWIWDHMKGKRVVALLKHGEEERAFVMLRAITDDMNYFQAINNCVRDQSKKITRWNDWIEYMMMRKLPATFGSMLMDFAIAFVKEMPQQSLVVAQAMPAGTFRDAILQEARKVETLRTGGITWARAMELGLDTPEGQKIGKLSIRQEAMKSPSHALSLILNAGPTAMNSELVDSVLEFMVMEDPAKAFATASAMNGQSAFRIQAMVIREWGRVEPRQALNEAILLPATSGGFQEVGTIFDEWIKEDPLGSRKWVISLKDCPGRSVCIGRIVQSLLSQDAVRAQGFLEEHHKPPYPENLCEGIASEWAKRSYREAARYILGLENKIEYRNINSKWRSIIVKWLEIEPQVAGDFLINLPDTPYVRFLNNGLGNSIDPRFAVALDGWSDGSAASAMNSTVLDRIRRDGNIPRKMTSKELVVAREIIVERTKDVSDLSGAFGMLGYYAANGMEDQVLPFLKDFQSAWMAAGRADESSRLIEQTVFVFCRESPAGVAGLLDSLASQSDDWLQAGVVALWSVGDSGQERMQVMQARARALLRIPQEKRAEVITLLLRKRSEVPSEILRSMLEPEAVKREQQVLERLLKALAGNERVTALLEAGALSHEIGDVIVCSILADFPTRADAEKAVASIEDPEVSNRMLAWLSVL